MMAATDADALADAIPEEEIAVTAVTETGIVTVTEIGMTGVGAEMTDAWNPDPLSLIPVLPAGVRIHASKIVRWQIPAVIAIIKKAGTHHLGGGSLFMHRDTHVR